MRLFRSRKAGKAKSSSSVERTSAGNAPTSSSSFDAEGAQQEQQPLTVASMIADLEGAEETSGGKPSRALRQLFSLSDETPHARQEMVRVADGKLTPTLLNFLERCSPGTSEQYLALLVLNSISMPPENKRLIALDHGGAHLLCRLLCKDPSCHLLAIILANLTFVDVETRRGMMDPACGIHLLDSLAFAVLASSFTKSEYQSRQHVMTYDAPNSGTPSQLLAALLEEDRRRRNYSSSYLYPRRSSIPETPPVESKQIFSKTARWSLCAVRNMTRPSGDDGISLGLIRTGILPLVLRFILVGEPDTPTDADKSGSSDDTPIPVSPGHDKDVSVPHLNAPSSWHSQTAQDAALFVVMNLAAAPSAREYLREFDAIPILLAITKPPKGRTKKLSKGRREVAEFQSLKARMAIAYLLGSEGHFGQSRTSRSSSSILADAVYSNHDEHQALVVGEMETSHWVELLANTLHRRSKEGSGGYSAATFSIKYVLFALRCLLTNRLNQERFAKREGSRLNALLVKSLAFHAFGPRGLPIDEDAAEYAVFSLYLLSNYGFNAANPFLPLLVGEASNGMTKRLAVKILVAYQRMATITPAGNHAAQQLLLRMKYLIFQGSVTDLTANRLYYVVFDREILKAADSVVIGKIKAGPKPLDDIFDRPVLRSRTPRRGKTQGALWENNASRDSFASALVAAQDFSFGSTKVRHMDTIDDIQIANNIAGSAQGETTESYGYLWSWKDKAKEIQRNLDRRGSSVKKSSPEKPKSPFLGFLGCAGLERLCGSDTTLK